MYFAIDHWRIRKVKLYVFLCEISVYPEGKQPLKTCLLSSENKNNLRNKGRVPKWHVFGPKNYDLRHPYSESALNSEYNSVSGILKI